ncbi:hypothetical protein Aduo_002075 [Ancylostoma duodenale]
MSSPETELFPQYEHTKLCFCSLCDSVLLSSHLLCWNEVCEMRSIPKEVKGETYEYALPTAHASAGSSASAEHQCIAKCPCIHLEQYDEHRHETPDFVQYREDIERPEDYIRRRIKVVLILNFDRVRMKKLSRTETWPVYLRLEGLPSDVKNNILLPAIMFISKTPTERLLRELFSR